MTKCDIPELFTLGQLNAMTTLEQGHFDNLKWVSVNHPKGVRIKVLLSRLTVEDGASCNNMVTVMCAPPPAPGRPDWLEIDEYEAR